MSSSRAKRLFSIQSWFVLIRAERFKRITCNGLTLVSALLSAGIAISPLLPYSSDSAENVRYSLDLITNSFGVSLGLGRMTISHYKGQWSNEDGVFLPPPGKVFADGDYHEVNLLVGSVGIERSYPSNAYDRRISFPLWWAAVAFAALPLVRFWRWRRTARRRSAGRCPNCGYDLRASRHRCPECGAFPFGEITEFG